MAQTPTRVRALRKKYCVIGTLRASRPRSGDEVGELCADCAKRETPLLLMQFTHHFSQPNFILIDYSVTLVKRFDGVTCFRFILSV